MMEPTYTELDKEGICCKQCGHESFYIEYVQKDFFDTTGKFNKEGLPLLEPVPNADSETTSELHCCECECELLTEVAFTKTEFVTGFDDKETLI